MALLLLLTAASPLMLKEGIESALMQDAYAATDTTKPKVAITKPSNGSTLPLGTIQVTGTASDNSGGSGVGKVEVRIDTHSYKVATPKATGDWSTWSISFSEKDTGTHILSARVSDNAGNKAWYSIKITTSSTTDTTKPKVAITSPTDGSTVLTGTMQVKGTASDNSGGSGVQKVEVRLDTHSYKVATPKATGDWSTWSISFSVTTTGEHTFSAKVTDKAGNQAWHPVDITASSTSSGSSSTDKFGVKILYPTKSGGEQWFLDMNDPKSDPRFDPGASLTKNSDGSWKIKSSQVRMNVHTSDGYDPDDIDTYNQKTLATQGYMQTSKDWRNVEVTGYVKFNSASSDNLSWYTRGGKHYDEDCEGTAYKGRLFYYSGETGFAKEQWHSGGYAFSSSKDVTSSIMDRWIGFKFIVYNTVQNGKTVAVLESWLNDAGDKTSSWKKVVSRVDSGGWGDEGDHCSGSADQIMTWGGPISGFRWDRASDVDFKWLSVREIQA